MLLPLAGSKPREASASVLAPAGISFTAAVRVRVLLYFLANIVFLVTENGLHLKFLTHELMNINKQAKGRKTRKAPSGPNPVGNQHPPSRP